MSKQDVQTNFQLSAEFNHYVLRHPDVVKGVGRNASVVVLHPKNKRLTEKNLRLARTLRQRRRVVYVASPEDGKWEVRRLR